MAERICFLSEPSSLLDYSFQRSTQFEELASGFGVSLGPTDSFLGVPFYCRSEDANPDNAWIFGVQILLLVDFNDETDFFKFKASVAKP